MAPDTHTIHDMFDALQERFGAFPAFEDVPASVLEAEAADEAGLAGPAGLVTGAVA